MKTIVITGVTSGIGRSIMMHFASLGHRVIGISRNPRKLESLKSDIIQQSSNANIITITCDFSSLKAVKKAAEKVIELHPEGIDVLINNAAIVPKAKKITEDGFEMQYQVNHLAVALMTMTLLPSLKKKQGRVITTGSDAHKRTTFIPNDIEAIKKYHSLRSYSRSKLYNLMLNLAFSRFYSSSGVTFYTVHPGLVKTNIGTKDTSKLYAFFWKLFTRRGFLPEETVPTFDYLVNTETLTHPYYYLSKPHNYLPIADREDYQNLLIEKTKKDLADWLT